MVSVPVLCLQSFLFGTLKKFSSTPQTFFKAQTIRKRFYRKAYVKQSNIRIQAVQLSVLQTFKRRTPELAEKPAQNLIHRRKFKAGVRN